VKNEQNIQLLIKGLEEQRSKLMVQREKEINGQNKWSNKKMSQIVGCGSSEKQPELSAAGHGRKRLK
jgi:hypothetical protein